MDECNRRTLNGAVISLAVVQTLSQSIGTLTAGFFELVQLYARLGPTAGFVHRVGEVLEVLEEWDALYAVMDGAQRVLYEEATSGVGGGPRGQATGAGASSHPVFEEDDTGLGE